MRLSNRLLFALALTLLAAPAATFGQEALAKGNKIALGAPKFAGVEEEIARLERQYNEAYRRGDAQALERLHTEDFRQTARGRVTTRAEVLARLKDAARPRDVIESLAEDGVQVRDYGQTVVTTGHWKRVSKSVDGRDTSAEGYFTRVWVRRGSGYQLAVAHYSPAARPPAQQ